MAIKYSTTLRAWIVVVRHRVIGAYGTQWQARIAGCKFIVDQGALS